MLLLEDVSFTEIFAWLYWTDVEKSGGTCHMHVENNFVLVAENEASVLGRCDVVMSQETTRAAPELVSSGGSLARLGLWGSGGPDKSAGECCYWLSSQTGVSLRCFSCCQTKPLSCVSHLVRSQLLLTSFPTSTLTRSQTAMQKESRFRASSCQKLKLYPTNL
jgi:hypothetical protein